MAEIKHGSADAGTQRKGRVAHAWGKMKKGFWGPGGDVVVDNPQQQEVANTSAKLLVSVRYFSKAYTEHLLRVQTIHHSLNEVDESARAHDPDQLADAHVTGVAPAQPQKADPQDDADDDDDDAHSTRGNPFPPIHRL